MTTKPNQYAGICPTCAQRVEAGAGTITKVDGKWKPVHIGACPTTVQVASEHLTPTAEQVAIIDAFATGEDLVVEAGAGAAKTSTLIMLAESTTRVGQYFAFSRKLVDDAATKFAGNVRVSTIHRPAYRAIVAGNPAFEARLKTARQRGAEVAAILGLGHWSMNYGKEVVTISRDRLASMVRKAVVEFCQSGDPTPERKHIAYVDGLDLPDKETGRRTYTNNDNLAAYLMPFVTKAWADFSSPTGALAWNRSHAFYLKMWELGGPVILADFLLVDEAQDVSGVMLSIIRQQTCQKVLVGDSSQAIFEFLGLVDALAIYRAEGARTLRLSKSFRFGQAVADVANGLLARIGTDMRLVGNERIFSTVAGVDDPKCILTRSNAKAVRTCLTLLADGYKPHLQGGADEVVAFAQGAAALQADPPRPSTHADLCAFENWAQVQAFVEQDEDGDELRLLVSLIDEFGPALIISALARTANAADADVVVSTAHKAKGLQWDSVQLADDFPAPRAGALDCSPSELRLLYVACTRAQRELDVTMCRQALAAPAGAPKAAKPVPAPVVIEADDEDDDEFAGLTGAEITARLWDRP